MLQNLIDVILPVFLVIGAGYGFTRFGYLNQTHIEGIMRFGQGIGIPCLLFNAISHIDLNASFDPRLLSSFYGGAFLCFCLGLFVARYYFKRDWEDAVAIGFCCLFSNSVLLGLQITERAYGPESLTGNYAIIAFHSPFCYFLGISAMEFVLNKGKPGPAFVGSIVKSMFKNALILAILAGFFVNLSGLKIPAVTQEALNLIIRAALPGALFALGGVLVQYKPEGDLRAIAFVCTVSLMVHPAFVWLFGSFVSLKQELFRSAVLNAAMAPGFNAYIFANMYGRAKRVAASSVLIATGSSIVTVWLWLGVLG